MESYNPEFARSFAYPLPEPAKKLLLSAEEVHKRLGNGEDPVALSLEKWEGIQKIHELIANTPNPHKYYSRLLDHIGIKNCALCVVSIHTFKRNNGTMKSAGDKCTVCPLAKIEPCTKPGSAYRQVEALLEEGSAHFFEEMPADEAREFHEKLGLAINAMLNNLKKLNTSISA